MPAPPRPIKPLPARGIRLPGLCLAGLLALAGCSAAFDEPPPRLLTTTELRDGIAALPTAAPSTQGLEARASALRGRAAALRSSPVDSGEARRLRQRAQQLALLER